MFAVLVSIVSQTVRDDLITSVKYNKCFPLFVKDGHWMVKMETGNKSGPLFRTYK